MTPAPDLAGIAALIIVIATLGYITSCLAFPFRACRRCAGAGKLRSPTGRAVRHCPRCRGTGLRVRPGRKLWNHLRRLHRNSSR